MLVFVLLCFSVVPDGCICSCPGACRMPAWRQVGKENCSFVPLHGCRSHYPGRVCRTYIPVAGRTSFVSFCHLFIPVSEFGRTCRDPNRMPISLPFLPSFSLFFVTCRVQELQTWTQVPFLEIRTDGKCSLPCLPCMIRHRDGDFYFARHLPCHRRCLLFVSRHRSLIS